MELLINKAKNLIYFLIIGWALWILEQLREGRKAKQEVLIDGYELKKKDLESKIEKEDLNKLIDNNNKLYKPSGGDSSSS